MNPTNLPSRTPRIHYGSIALAVLFAAVPLVFDTRLADVFLLDKTILALSVLLFLLSGFGRAEWAVMGGAPVFRWAAAFVAWMFVGSLFTAISPGEILPGALHWLILLGSLGVGLAAGGGLRRKAEWFLGMGSALVALLALAQAANLDRWIDWTTRFNGRVFSTFGNPNHLAGYLAAVLPWSAVKVLRAREAVKRRWAVAHLALLSLAFVVAGVRGAVIGLGLGMGALLICLAAHREGRGVLRKNRNFLATALVAAFLLGVGWTVRHGGLSTFSLSGETAVQRLETWRVTAFMIKDHPLFGVGLGNFKAQVPAYQWRVGGTVPGPGAPTPYTLTEHVHNEYLQVCAEGGLTGLALFLAFWGVGLSALWKGAAGLPDRDTAWDSLAAIGALGSILGFSLSNFPLQLAAPAVLAGWALSVSTPGPDRGTFERIGPLPILVLLFSLVVFGRWAAGSVAFRDTTGEYGLSHAELAVRYAGRLVRLEPRRYRAWYAAGQAWTLAGTQQGFDNAIPSFEQAIRLDPFHAEAYLGKAALLIPSGKSEEALETAEAGIAVAPNLHGLQFVKGSALFQLKRYPEAEKAFVYAAWLLPDHYETWLNLGVARVLQGNKQGAFDAWTKALSLRPGDPQATQYLQSVGIKQQ